MKKKIFSKVWIAMILVVVIAVAAWLLSGGKKEEQINFKQEKVATHTLQNSITATGTIEAVTSVTGNTARSMRAAGDSQKTRCPPAVAAVMS